MITIQEHVQAVYQVIRETLALGNTARSPEFYGLLETVLRQRAPGTASPPWLMLPIFTCEAVGGDTMQAQPVAAALELGRLAAGCLDEWQDRDTKGALWRDIGPERAINAGTALVALSFLAVGRLDSRQTAPVAILEIQREFELTLLTMCAGQHADLSDDLHLDDYEAVAGAKSGALFRLGCRTGALVAGAPPRTVDRYGDFGYNLGILAQMWNDLQGIAGFQGKMDAEKPRALPAVAALTLGQSGYEPGSTEGQVGDLYALVRLQAYHQRASSALAECPSPGRLTLFLDDYSTRELVDRASQLVARDEED